MSLVVCEGEALPRPGFVDGGREGGKRELCE
jgi:hypothetical protein